MNVINCLSILRALQWNLQQKSIGTVTKHGSACWSILNTHFLMITLTTNINGDYALFGLAICPGSDVKTEEGKARKKT